MNRVLDSLYVSILKQIGGGLVSQYILKVILRRTDSEISKQEENTPIILLENGENEQGSGFVSEPQNTRHGG